MSTRVIESFKDFPYGSYAVSYTGSSNGFPPLLNPEQGEIFIPKTDYEYKAYFALANKLTGAINAAIPEEKHTLVQFDSRSPSDPVWIAVHGLSAAAFKLDYYVDPTHPLLKIATLENFSEFRAAVLAL
jgi:hypothetical protein